MTEDIQRQDQEAEPIEAATDETDDEAQAVAAEVDELRDELEQLNDRHLRLAAEFENYRKRADRDRDTIVARLQVDLVSSLLDVVDDLERVAETGESASAEAVIEGVRLVEKKFITILTAAGLEPIEAEGALFDPAVMEAMATVPADDASEDGQVASVYQRGYWFAGVLVRPARVTVKSFEGRAEGSE